MGSVVIISSGSQPARTEDNNQFLQITLKSELTAMEQNSTDTWSSDSEEEIFWADGFSSMEQHHLDNMSQYVRSHQRSTNTKLFSFLALLNTYNPESYLQMSECQKVLGPPDLIHGGPPFEDRMEPFTILIRTSTEPPGYVSIYPESADIALEVMAYFGHSRSSIMMRLMSSLCGDEPQTDTMMFLKDLLTKREMGTKGKEKFSRLVQDICDNENPHKAVSVLEMASDKLRQYYVLLQTLSRLYLLNVEIKDYKMAKRWAKIAIERAPNNSFVADTLGQVHKNCLMRSNGNQRQILNMAREAWMAFKDVARKAEGEEGPEMEDESGAIHISTIFNNRGYFGLIQVAKIAFEKLRHSNPNPQQVLNAEIQNLREEVEAKFDFFEDYLTYSLPGKTSLEPPYFWKDVVVCYEHYTGEAAADSISFPGLLECLNRGHFVSRGRRSGFEEDEETVSDLEEICNDLKTTYEGNVTDEKAAERYILSNIILSNKISISSALSPLRELQTILSTFLDTRVGKRGPEFYLLVLLLFWPEEHTEAEEEDEEEEEEDDEEEGEEEEQPATTASDSDYQTWEDDDGYDDQETEGESAQPPPGIMFEPDLQKQITFMEKAFEEGYAKYLRGRYLVPLFFLGKGSGLSKWIHKSRLDAIIEEMVNAEFAYQESALPISLNIRKKRKINELWRTGEVWRIPDIQDILLPVMIEPTLTGWEKEGCRVFVYVGGRKIQATTEFGPIGPTHRPTVSYLGFTIKGPVVFK
ncbi:sterile alpha motif domain-containing protein 9-like isoform X1 [Xyrichtys novacula]|uniref:Sterile alpha motif domain-containing protein 9-like isoform X1 n=1 Tax=Xyrichtys novacula TaxID=13765 RepID=A0AAV1HJ01_XYRNO|nr:sterile alpha motif domain-containing protein 9-like isoform X1 [Xyrichtys novacula]